MAGDGSLPYGTSESSPTAQGADSYLRPFRWGQRGKYNRVVDGREQVSREWVREWVGEVGGSGWREWVGEVGGREWVGEVGGRV